VATAVHSYAPRPLKQPYMPASCAILLSVCEAHMVDWTRVQVLLVRCCMWIFVRHDSRCQDGALQGAAGTLLWMLALAVVLFVVLTLVLAWFSCCALYRASQWVCFLAL
jgi:hypothetical protein